MSRHVAIGAAVVALAVMTLAVLARAERPGIDGWTCPTGEVLYLKFSPDDHYLAAFVRRPSDRITCQLLVLDTRTQATLLMADGIWPTHLCFSQSSDRLAVMWYGKLAVYDVFHGELIFEVPPPNSHGYCAIGLSQTGEQLVMRSTMRLDEPMHEVAWEIESGTSTAEYGMPRLWDGLEAGMLLSPDGSTWTSGGWPGPTPRVIRLDDPGFYTYCFYFPWPIFRDFTPDSQNLITLHEDGALFLWELRNTGNENARIVKSEAHTGLESAKGWALLSTSGRIAYIDQDDRLRFRRLFTGPPVADPGGPEHGVASSRTGRRSRKQ